VEVVRGESGRRIEGIIALGGNVNVHEYKCLLPVVLLDAAVLLEAAVLLDGVLIDDVVVVVTNESK
jgi:hypothetical protein